MLRVLSVFDGISILRQVFKDLDIPVEYHALEIDKTAIQVSKANHNDIIYHGDVRNFHIDKPFDIIAGGSPCQDISLVNLGGQGLEGSKSGLFYEYVRLLDEAKRYNPDVLFLLENVKGRKQAIEGISSCLGVAPSLINSKHFVRQNRPRYYWTNININPIPDEPDWSSDGYKYYVYQFKKWHVASYAFCLTQRLRWWIGDKQIHPMGSILYTTQHLHNYDDKTYHPIDYYRPYLIDEKHVESLQGYPEGYVSSVDISPTAKMRAIGNGWTLPVIKHIIGSHYA